MAAKLPAPVTYAEACAARDAAESRLLAFRAMQATDPIVSELLRAKSSLLALRSARNADPRSSSNSPRVGANDASA